MIRYKCFLYLLLKAIEAVGKITWETLRKFFQCNWEFMIFTHHGSSLKWGIRLFGYTKLTLALSSAHVAKYLKQYIFNVYFLHKSSSQSINLVLWVKYSFSPFSVYINSFLCCPLSGCYNAVDDLRVTVTLSNPFTPRRLLWESLYMYFLDNKSDDWKDNT